MYRKIVVAFAALAALAVAGIAQSSVSSAQDGGPDRLFGGGRFVFDFDLGPGELILPRDIGVEAIGFDGHRSTGTRYYGNPDRQDPAPAVSISCLGVEGSSAVIGAIDAQGNKTVQYFRDNGPPGPAPADRITPVLLPSTPEDFALMPKRFPLVCPSATPPAEWGDPWVDLDSGDIAVVDG
jgi:hypothetical protein